MPRKRQWRIVDADNYSLRIFDQDDEEIALMVADPEDDQSDRTREQRDEDAALMAASPEILKALQAFVEEPLPDGQCHRGLCSEEECGICSKHAAGRKALALAGIE